MKTVNPPNSLLTLSETEIQRQRVVWIDTLKGFGIFLVFLGHTTLINKNVDHYIFSFHMPLFFFISGVLFKTDASGKYNQFILKELKTRMMPYLAFGLLTYLIWLLFFLLRKYVIYQGSAALPESLFYKPLVGMLYGNGIDGWMTHNVILWFLACLFVTEIIFFTIFRAFKEKRVIMAVLVAFATFGYLDSMYSPIRLPFSVDIAFTAVVFYGLGYLFKDYLLHSEINIGIGIFFLVLGLCAGFLNARVDMNFNIYGNPVLFYISSLSSIYAFICFAKKIPVFKPLEYIGSNSLIFFLLQATGSVVINIFAYTLFRLRPNNMEPNFLYACIYVLLTIIVLFPFVIIINKKIPFITGRSK